MKRILCLILSILLILSVTACGEKETAPSSSSEISSVDISSTVNESADTSSIPDTDEAFLETVTYRDYELTGEKAPCYIGRWFDKKVDGKVHKVTVTDGSMMYFMVNGADSFTLSFTVTTGDDIPYFAYSIDGSQPIRKLVTDGTVNLPDKGRHTVRIITDGLTEYVDKWYNELGFALKEVTASEGGEIIGIRPKNKVIFFYGDSITEGVCSISKGFFSPNNSATNAFPWFCSEMLGVTPYYVGYSGSGVVTEGSLRPFEVAINSFSYNFPAKETATPDVILINHGANDAGASDEAFREGLITAIDKLRKNYPNIPIVYMITFGQTKKNVITEVMADVENSYIVHTEGWGIPTNDGYHPTPDGAKNAGERLAMELKYIFGNDFFN